MSLRLVCLSVNIFLSIFRFKLSSETHGDK